MGASVTMLDIDLRKLRMNDEAFQGRLITMIADNYNIRLVIMVHLGFQWVKR
jgi:alanine dehydrogenase